MVNARGENVGYSTQQWIKHRVVQFLTLQDGLHFYKFQGQTIVQWELIYLYLQTCQMSLAGARGLVLQLHFSQEIINRLEKVCVLLLLFPCIFSFFSFILNYYSGRCKSDKILLLILAVLTGSMFSTSFNTNSSDLLGSLATNVLVSFSHLFSSCSTFI